jgi:hypothetical protein
MTRPRCQGKSASLRILLVDNEKPSLDGTPFVDFSSDVNEHLPLPRAVELHQHHGLPGAQL